MNFWSNITAIILASIALGMSIRIAFMVSPYCGDNTSHSNPANYGGQK
jgi:hypothetical protein